MMSFEPADLQRINLVGTSGSGKSTTGRRLAEILKSPYIEMDVLYHGPNWTQAQPEVFRARVAGAIAGPRWVLDGNYHRTSDLKWARATMIVWLDIAWVPNMYRAVGRAVPRRTVAGDWESRVVPPNLLQHGLDDSVDGNNPSSIATQIFSG